MTDQIVGVQASFHSLIYDDGTIYEPPQMMKSWNGYYYKPDDIRTDPEIRSGRSKTFGRRTGEDEAKEYLNKHILTHFKSRNWEVPSRVIGAVPQTFNSGMRRSTRYGASYMDFAFLLEPFGWAWYRVTVDSAVRHSLKVPALAAAFYAQSFQRVNVRDSVLVQEWTSDDVGDYDWQGFAEDPWGHVMGAWRKWDGSLLEGIGRLPLERIPAPPPPKGWIDEKEIETDTFRYERIGNADLFIPGQAQKILKASESVEAMLRTAEALTHLGFDMNVIYGSISKSAVHGMSGQGTDGSYQSFSDRAYGVVSVPSGLQIEVSEEGGHSHTLIINSDADVPVQVRCSYKDEESAWIRREKQKALEAMTDIESELAQYEITLGGNE